MKQTDRSLQHAKQAGAAERPAILQQNVVLLLDANPSEFAQHIEPVRQVLKLNEFDLPVALLFRNDGLQGHGGIAMSPAAVVENDVYSFHWPDFDTGTEHSTRAHTACHVDKLLSLLCSISSMGTFMQIS